MELRSSQEEATELVSSLLLYEDTVRRQSSINQEEDIHQEHKYAGTLILDLQAKEVWRMLIFKLFKL